MELNTIICVCYTMKYYAILAHHASMPIFLRCHRNDRFATQLNVMHFYKKGKKERKKKNKRINTVFIYDWNTQNAKMNVAKCVKFRQENRQMFHRAFLMFRSSNRQTHAYKKNFFLIRSWSRYIQKHTNEYGFWCLIFVVSFLFISLNQMVPKTERA